MTILRMAAEGGGVMAEALAASVGSTYCLHSLSLHLNDAPATSENLTITLDAQAGAHYDALLYSVDLSAGATTDLLWQPDDPLYLVGGDRLVVAWANSDSRTWGLLVTAEAV